MKVGTASLLILCAAQSTALAQPLYKCKQADGQLAFQDKPCTSAKQVEQLQRAPRHDADWSTMERMRDFAEHSEKQRSAQAAQSAAAHQNAMTIERRQQALDQIEDNLRDVPVRGGATHRELLQRQAELQSGVDLEPPAPKRRSQMAPAKAVSPTFVDPITNKIYNRLPGGGAINAQTGEFMPGAPNGPIIDPRTALPIPGQ